LKKLLMSIAILGCIICGANADARMIIIPTAKSHTNRIALDHKVSNSYNRGLLYSLIGEEMNGYTIVDIFISGDYNNLLTLILYKEKKFYRTYIEMPNLSYVGSIGELFDKKLKEMKKDDVSEDSE